MTERDVLLSVSLLTVEVQPDGEGTQMTVTEQVAFFEAVIRRPAARPRGDVDKLATHLEEDRA